MYAERNKTQDCFKVYPLLRTEGVAALNSPAYGELQGGGGHSFLVLFSEYPSNLISKCSPAGASRGLEKILTTGNPFKCDYLGRCGERTLVDLSPAKLLYFEA